MGGLNCCKGENLHTDIDSDVLRIQYGEDSSVKNAVHDSDIKCSNPQLSKILFTFTDALKVNRTLYKDPCFSTDSFILQMKNNTATCNFQRPFVFLHHQTAKAPYPIIDPHASPEQVQVNDQIMQYFGVFLCFLSNKPYLLKKIILTQPNTYGLHFISVYIRGIKKYIVIDDHVLCQNGKPLFCQPWKSLYLWPNLLQKGWFKMKRILNSNLEEGNIFEVFETFLPIPLERINVEEKFSSPFQLREYFSQQKLSQTQYILVSKIKPKHMIGISGQKYFYLLGTFKHENKLLFYVRNPCGQQSFRGAYELDEFRMAIEKRLCLEVKEGNFILSEDEFLEQISQMLAIHYIPENQISTQSFTIKNYSQNFYKFQIKQKGTLALSLLQPGTKLQASPFIYEVYKNSIIGGAKESEGCFGYKNTNLLTNVVEEVSEGEYTIRIKMKEQYTNRQSLPINFIAYHRNPVILSNQDQFQAKTKWNTLLENEGRKILSSNKSQIKIQQKKFRYTICWLEDLAFIYVENISRKQSKLRLELNFPELKNLQCVSHPEIKCSPEYKVLELNESLLIVFQKVVLREKASINGYSLEAF